MSTSRQILTASFYIFFSVHPNVASSYALRHSIVAFLHLLIRLWQKGNKIINKIHTKSFVRNYRHSLHNPCLVQEKQRRQAEWNVVRI